MGGVADIRGRLMALGCADILEFLRVLNRAGLLAITSNGTAIGLYLRAGKVVHATSTRSSDRLSDQLVQWGVITQEQCGEAMVRAAGGERMGRALLESGGLSPRRLVEARHRLVRQIGTSVFEWEEGEFAFHEGEAPADVEVEVDLPITALLLEGIRSVRNLELFRKRLPFDDWVFEALAAETLPAEPGLEIEAHEDHVLNLVDGTRTVGQIAALSEFGPEETLRTLFLLFAIGRLKMKSRPAEEPAGDPTDGFEGILRRYNGMLGLVYQYMMKEVGPISEHLLWRSLREQSAMHPGVFHRASLGGDGTVDAGLLRENLNALAGRRRRDALVQGLNELLYAELLVLRKTLGPDHEGRVLRAFREMRAREPEDGGA